MHIQRSRCSPAAIVDGILQAQLVDPHLTRLHTTGQVANTNHHSLYLTQRRITHHRDAVVGLVGVIVAEGLRVAGGTQSTGLVAGLLDLREDAEVDIKHVGRWPDSSTVVHIIFIIIAAVGCQLQGDDILVVVALVVATHADKDSQLVILQIAWLIINQMVGMHEHLQVLILAQVEDGIAIDGFRLAWREILHHHRERLLVGLGQLGL